MMILWWFFLLFANRLHADIIILHKFQFKIYTSSILFYKIFYLKARSLWNYKRFVIFLETNILFKFFSKHFHPIVKKIT